MKIDFFGKHEILSFGQLKIIMMKNKLLNSILACFLVASISCREETLIANETSNANDIEIKEGTVKDGRLYFPNKESLQVTYNNLKDAEDEVIANYIDTKNIISLRPILTKDNEDLVQNKILQRIEKLKTNKRYMRTSNALNKLNNNEKNLLISIVNKCTNLLSMSRKRQFI
ncbi:hypothetical protein [Soonwooa sp.]|uniref:hypothetical protein n=1 Tax=Soonwooa sp. TaxID=1938592 RepID=UPI0028AAB421|nr:hypothetical protein [Soonwooa sp.]